MLTWEPRIRSLRTKSTHTYKRIAEGEIEVCCHRITWWFDITGIRHAESVLERLESEAEEKCRYDLNKGCHSGELCFCGQTDDGRDIECHGWWNIKD
jgi:hypothetical protein